MRHNAFIKCIALLLCTVSLLGVAASGFGILAMAEGGLYNRSVDDMLDELVRSQGADLAHTLAVRYAGETLGNLPPEILERFDPYFYRGVLNNNYRYAILDGDGNLLTGEDAPENCTAYSFPVEGKYMHLVSLMTEAEKYPSHQPKETSPSEFRADDLYLYNNVPSLGAPVSRFIAEFEDGDHEEFDDGLIIGNAYYADDAIAFLLPNFRISSHHSGMRVTQITLIGSDGISDDVLLYQAVSSQGVGFFNYSGEDSTIFISTVSATATVEETISVTEAETIPETVAETEPATEPETIPPTTVPETTVPEIKVEVTDRIPESGMAEVTELDAHLTSGSHVSHKDEYGIGRIYRDGDGNITFSSYENWASETGSVTHILFRNENGEILFEAACEESFAELRYNSDHHISFAYTPPAPKETIPETEPTTVPTTVPETIPETVPETIPETTFTYEVVHTEPVFAEPVIINGKALEEYEINTTEYYDQDTGERMYAQYVYAAMPAYTVMLYLTPDSFSYSVIYDILRVVQCYQQYLLPVLGACFLVFIVCIVYLFCAAGHSRKYEEIRPGLLNRIPLDLYLACACIGVPLLVALLYYGTTYLLPQDLMLGIACAASCGFAACLLIVGFLFAAAAQFKAPNGFWWRNTLCGHGIRLCIRILAWMKRTLMGRLLPWLRRVGKALWGRTCTTLTWFFRKAEKVFLWAGIKLSKCLAWIGNLLHRFLTLLPVTWQWLAVGFVMFLMIFMAFDSQEPNILFLVFGICIALIVYGSHCFGSLLDAAKNMRQGDLHHKVDDKIMIGSFQEFAEELNALAGVAMIAAQKQLKSERMKTELITNVSHDIKTPLTSIINYVDLLQKPHTVEEGAQYLEVLSRQSQQLKKLIEDLMDMSKASTGNMNVEIGCVDAVESINQALGEFADKLDKAQIVPVFRHSKDSVPMMADGRLVWRVLSNLLGNAIKYAMPGTRLYVDLMELDGSVVISMKNISREELSIDADELMERFVRGDGSRNTEGSGLGLNIAKSLMELQNGQMQLLVDGDLFKVTLHFPGV